MPVEVPARGFAARLRSIGRFLQRMPRRWAWAFVIGWAGLIWVFSSFTPPVSAEPDPTSSVVTNFGHALEYGVLALLLALTLPRHGGWPDLTPRTMKALLVVVFLYAVSDEIHQSFTPDRDPSVFDVLTDCVGAAATLEVIAAAGGQRARPGRLPRLFLVGILACLVCGVLATFVPDRFPEYGWL